MASRSEHYEGCGHLFSFEQQISEMELHVMFDGVKLRHELRLSGGKNNLKRCEMGEKKCHVCQQKENKSQKLYCVFLFIYICLIVAPEMYLFAVSFRHNYLKFFPPESLNCR